MSTLEERVGGLEKELARLERVIKDVAQVALLINRGPEQREIRTGGSHLGRRDRHGLRAVE